MKRIISLIMIIGLTVACAAGRVAASEKHRGEAPAKSPAPGVPAIMGAGGKDRTDLDVFAIDAAGAIKWTPAGSNDWNTRVPGYNIVRRFVNKASQEILFLLNSNTGEAETFVLNADGSVGKSPWWTGTHPMKELRCTSAELVKIGGVTNLITQDSLTGRVRVFALNADGSPTLTSTTMLADMQDKNLFRVYYHSFYGYQMIGVDTWSGEAVVYWMDMQKIAAKKWTRGWTNIDNLYIDGVSYRLLYKAAGDPFTQAGENSDQVGRFLIEQVKSNGVDGDMLQDIQIGDEYSSVRFIELASSEEGLRGYGILCYRRTTGQYVLYGFNPKTGIGKLIDQGAFAEPTLLPAPPYTDFQPSVVNGKTFLGFISPDHANAIGFQQANRMAQVIHDAMDDTTVGYQFMLAQSGRILYRRAWGKLKLDHDSSAEIDMTTHTQLEMASVAKMITGMTVLKLVEQGLIDLNAPISNYLASGQALPGSWPTKTPVFNLLTHTTGLKQNICKSDYSKMTIDCTPFFNATPDLICGFDANGKYNCPRKYLNSNIKAARSIIEFVTGAQTSKDIVKQTRDLWATSVDLDTMTCQMNGDAYYYSPCDGTTDCFDSAGASWRREREVSGPDGWLPLCSSNHWYASSRELMAFLGAIRYGKIINNQILTDLLLSTDLIDLSGVPGSTALSWDPPSQVNSESVLAKGGGYVWKSVAARAYITRLPNNCDSVIQLNTASGLFIPTVVKDAFKTAVPN